MHFCVVDATQERAVLKELGEMIPRWSGLAQEVTAIPQAPFQSQTQAAMKDREEKPLLYESS